MLFITNYALKKYTKLQKNCAFFLKIKILLAILSSSLYNYFIQNKKGGMYEQKSLYNR